VSYVEYEVPAEGTQRHLLAVALNGRFTSYFSDRQPPAAADSDADGQMATAPPVRLVLEQSPETRLVVVSNAAFLSDLVARALALDSGFFASNLAFVQNLIDWVNLDSDMLAIRSRGAGVRRLARVERSTEITIEVVNYAVPAFALLLFGAYRYWRRSNTAPIVPLRRPRVSRKAQRAEG
jgi:hypothetical protein